MLTVVAALAFQSVQPYRPILPLGCSPRVSALVKKIAELTLKADYQAAKTDAALLPKRLVKIEWNDANLSPANRSDYAQQRDRVFSEWLAVVPLANFDITKTGSSLSIGFKSGSGVDFSWSDDPSKPRLSVQIGTGTADSPVDFAEVHNDVSYAIGSYFGVPKLPMEGFLMSGPSQATNPLAPSQVEVQVANSNLSVCQEVSMRVSQLRPVDPGQPSLEGNPGSLDLGTVVQGTSIDIKMILKNAGTGTMNYRILPDCSCFSVARAKTLEAGTSVDEKDQLVARMSTTEYTGIIQGGVLHHALFLISNDPAEPFKVIPVQVKVSPRYRMFPFRQVVIADDKGEATIHAYLYFPPDHPIEVLSAESVGLPGDVTFAPWNGEMADPELNEGPLPRKGYQFTLKLKNIADGTLWGTNIIVSTNDPQFGRIAYPAWVQKGIVVQPQSLFLGEVGSAPRKMQFLVSRPGKTFKITAIKSDSAHLATSIAPGNTAGEYKVSVLYDGKAVQGDYKATLMIYTDDPSQQEIDVPVSGTIR